MADPIFDGDVRHVIFIEEAHNLIGPEAQVVTGENADPKQAATAFISDMLREVRAYREGIVIADQLPSAIAPEVLKTTGLKVALRITSSDDRKLLGSMMTANAMQIEAMATAEPGTALVVYEGLKRPFEVRMAEWLNSPESSACYVADMALRSSLRVSRSDDSLRKSLESRGIEWYLQGCLNAAFIDLDSMKDRIDLFSRRSKDALRAANDIYVDRTAFIESGKDESEVAKHLAIMLEGELLSIRAAGMKDVNQFDLRCAELIDLLVDKSLNWPPTLEPFKVFSSSASIRVFAEIDFKDESWSCVQPVALMLFKLYGALAAMRLCIQRAHPELFSVEVTDATAIVYECISDFVKKNDFQQQGA